MPIHLFLQPFVVFVCLVSSFALVAQEKPNLVLLPIEVSESDAAFESDFGAALEEGLQQNFTVFYGAEVEKLLEKEYEKIDCTAESCNQALAVAFNGELIADASVKHLSSGYILKLRITNVLTNQVIQTTSVPCQGCNEFDVLRQLKVMGSGETTSVPPEPAPVTQTKAVTPVDSTQRAILIFDSEPTGAEVFLDGKQVGKTPYQGLNHFLGSELALEIKKEGYSVYPLSITLEQPITQLQPIALVSDKGKLLVATEPYVDNAKVYVNGEFKGIAPLEVSIDGGDHEVIIKKDDQSTGGEWFLVDDGATVQAVIDLKDLRDIKEEVIPEGANVVYNGDVQVISTPVTQSTEELEKQKAYDEEAAQEVMRVCIQQARKILEEQSGLFGGLGGVTAESMCKRR